MVNEKWITDEIMALKQGGSSSKAHASTHGNTGTDRVTLDASQITTGVLDAARIPAQLLSDYSIIPIGASLLKSNKDAAGTYLTYTWYLSGVFEEGTPVKWVSELNSSYSRRVLSIYDVNGTKLCSYTFNRTLDSDGNLVSETKVV